MTGGEREEEAERRAEKSWMAMWTHSSSGEGWTLGFQNNSLCRPLVHGGPGLSGGVSHSWGCAFEKPSPSSLAP